MPQSHGEINAMTGNVDRSGERTLLLDGIPEERRAISTSLLRWTPREKAEHGNALVGSYLAEGYYEHLELRLAEATEKEAELIHRLEDFKAYVSQKIGSMEDTLEIAHLARAAKELELSQAKTLDDRDCIEGYAFNLFSTAVIVTNMVMIVLEIQHPHLVRKWWKIDQLVLLFYVGELAVKVWVFRTSLFIGDLFTVWWNWMDSVVVLSGMLDQWIMPLLIGVGIYHQGNKHHGPAVLNVLRMLRLARLARCFKVLRLFIESELSWTEGPRFQSFMLAVVFFNSVLIGLETDIDFDGWYYVEQVLLVIYVFELCVRLKRSGFSRFLCERDGLMWNFIDSFIVLGGVLDQWMLPMGMLLQEAITGESPSLDASVKQYLPLLRLTRLFRILRLARLVKSVPQLYILLVGIQKSCEGLSWVLVLTAVFLYACAILSTRVIGHGILFGGAETPAAVKALFPSVMDTMFILFKVMNGDQDCIAPLFEFLPGVKVFFVLFMVSASWAVVAIFTSVVADNVLSVTDQAKQDREKEQAKCDRERRFQQMVEIFDRMDLNGNGMLSEEEFAKVLQEPHVFEELCEAADLDVRDLEDLFDILSRTHVDESVGQRKIGHRAFIDGMQKCSDLVSMKSMMRIEKRLDDLRIGQQRLSIDSQKANKLLSKIAAKLGVEEDEVKGGSELPTPRGEKRLDI